MHEPDFTRKIHKLLSDVHAWKISDPYHRGVPDAWYSGTQRDLWVEYKFKDPPPKRAFKPDLTEFQRQWLTARHNDGRNVAVIVGTPKGAQIFHGLAGLDRVPPEFPLTHKELAAYIASYVND